MARKRFNTYSVFLHLLLVGQAVLLVALIQQNRNLQRFAPSKPTPLEEGETVQPVVVSSLEDRKRIIEWTDTDRERLLLVFTTTCAICQENLESWRSLYERLADRVDFVGISLSDMDLTRAYRDNHALPFPVVIPADPKGFTRDYKVPGVPATIYVGSGGRVRGAWLGGLTNQVLVDLEATVAGAAAAMSPNG